MSSKSVGKTVTNLVKVDQVEKGDSFVEFKSSGNVALNREDTGTPVVILRDTGASQSLLIRSCLPGIDQNITEDRVIL